MSIPTPEDCDKNACSNSDQQFSRILRRWAALPYGKFSECESNHQRLRVAIEYKMLGFVLKKSSDPTLHEFWSDGIEFVEWRINDLSYFFGGHVFSQIATPILCG